MAHEAVVRRVPAQLHVGPVGPRLQSGLGHLGQQLGPWGLGTFRGAPLSRIAFFSASMCFSLAIWKGWPPESATWQWPAQRGIIGGIPRDVVAEYEARLEAEAQLEAEEAEEDEEDELPPEAWVRKNRQTKNEMFRDPFQGLYREITLWGSPYKDLIRTFIVFTVFT